MSDSSSSGTSFVLILLALGGCVWLILQAFTEPAKPAPTAAVKEAEPVTSTSSRAIDFSKANGEAMNNSMNDQLKSVQDMTGGSFDGKTYVLPQSTK